MLFGGVLFDFLDVGQAEAQATADFNGADAAGSAQSPKRYFGRLPPLSEFGGGD